MVSTAKKLGKSTIRCLDRVLKGGIEGGEW